MKKKSYQILTIIMVILLFIVSAAVISGCEVGDEKQNDKESKIQVEESTKTESYVLKEEEKEEEVPQIIDISPEEVYEIISKGEEFLILDVRTPDEFNEGHIEGALLIPVVELENRLDELPKDKPIITYCRSGVRSRSAANILLENGFTPVYDMNGGILAWINKGYPVMSGE